MIAFVVKREFAYNPQYFMVFRPLEIGVKTDTRMSDEKELLFKGLVMDLFANARIYPQP